MNLEYPRRIKTHVKKTWVLVGREKQLRSSGQNPTPPQGTLRVVPLDFVAGSQPVFNTDTGDHKSAVTGISQPWFLLSLFTLCTLCFCKCLNSFSCFLPVLALFLSQHFMLPFQINSTPLRWILSFSDLFFSE